MQLTKNFKLSEFSVSASRPDLVEPVPEDMIPTVQRLADELQKIRDMVLVPMRITSGYRSEKLNKAVGGSSTSQHRTGEAADVAAGMMLIFMLLSGRVKADIGQVIAYPHQHFIHIALPSKKYPKPTFFICREPKKYEQLNSVKDLEEMGF